MKRDESYKILLLIMNQHITNDDSAVLIKKIIDPDLKKNKQNDIIIKICDRGHAKNMNFDAHQDYDLQQYTFGEHH